MNPNANLNHITSSIALPCHICSYYPIPKHKLRFFSEGLYLASGRKLSSHPLNNTSQIHRTSKSSSTLTATNSCSKGQKRKIKRAKPIAPPFPRQPPTYLDQLHTAVHHNEGIKHKHTQKDPLPQDRQIDTSLANVVWMWWANFKAALGQRINVQGIVSFVGVVVREPQLAIPHVMVPDISYVDWAHLKRKGFQGVVFDKDNTITVPYTLALWPPIASSVETCKSEFGNNVAVFSNSAGLHEYDPDGRKATSLESVIGIKVIRHRVKKPAGMAQEIERHFGCQSSRLIMVGDRPFTDVVYGNRNGFLTILTEPLSLAEEPFIVKMVRKLEVAIVNQWSRKSIKPISHKLLADAGQFVKDLPHTFE